MCARPNLGRHVTCLAIDDDNWLVNFGFKLVYVIPFTNSLIIFKLAGGGPKLSMWHLRSLKPLNVLEFNNELFMPNVCKIHENSVSFINKNEENSCIY